MIPGMRKSFTASEIIIYPEYDPETYAYDVAILKERYEVSSPIKYRLYSSLSFFKP